MSALAERPWLPAAVAFVLGGLLTAAGMAFGSAVPAVRSPTFHLVLETVVTMVAAFAALLTYGRYRRTRQARDLLLVHALVLLSLAALAFVLLRGLVDGDRGERASAWAALALRCAGAVGLLAAALAPASARVRRARPLRDAGALLALLGLTAVGAVLLSDVLPDVVRVSRAVESSAAPSLTAPSAVLVVQVGVLLCFAGAGAAFSTRSARLHDDLLGWFGAAMVLGAWARLAYLAYPTQFSAWLSTGDVLRLGCYGLLVVGAVRELTASWHTRTGIAVEAERRRLARDLHDGVVQELGYIRAQASRGQGDPAIASAADRAMFEARRAIQALALQDDGSLVTALHDVAHEASERHGVEVQVAAEGLVREPDADTREALVRVAREAVTNAARHSGAGRVEVRLTDRRLAVTDAGRGFSPPPAEGPVPAGRGFGLVSMRERAAAVGATVVVRSAPGQGTTVEAVW